MFEDTQTVSNPGPNPLEVWFEPWGMLQPLPPGESFRVVGRSPQAGQMEVVESGDAVVVYAWPGATLQVFNGAEMVDEFRIAVPDLPPGTSTRAFVEDFFGGPSDRQDGRA
jgi:hypothetical protein